MIGNISSIKFSLPKKRISIKNLSERNRWNYNKIVEKTGIKYIYKSSKKETALTLATKAAKKLRLNKKNVDILIYVTQSPEYSLPTNACIIQDNLKLKNNIMTFDVNQGCSGFLYGLNLAQKLLKKNKKSQVLLICSDTYTKSIDYRDKSCSTIFSDGATATLLNNKDNFDTNKFIFYTDGSGYKDLILDNKSKKFLYMNGKKVLFFTMSVIPNIVKNLLKKEKLSVKDIKYFIFHQASKIVLDNLSRKLNIPNNQMFRNYQLKGNTVSSTIPLCLVDLKKKKLIKKNDKILLCGFGVGLSASATIMKV